MRIIGLIPARSGSKGVTNKNLRLLGGKTLLNWSVQASLSSKLINQTIVSTDSPEYAELARSYGAEVPFLRPRYLATDSSPDTDFILHTMSKLEEENKEPDVIVHLRPTTPLRNPSVVDQAIGTFLSSNIEFTCLRSVQEMSESAYKTFEVDEHGVLMTTFSKSYDIEKSNQARQGFPKTYSPNGYVDVLSRKFIKKSGLIHGNRAKAFLTNWIDEIDTEEDLSRLNFHLSIDSHPLDVLFRDPR